MERIAKLLKTHSLVGADSSRLEQARSASALVEGEASIYPRSLRLHDKILYFIGRTGEQKSLMLASERSFRTELSGGMTRVGGYFLFRAERSAENARALHELFPFTQPISLRDKRTTIGCGDRLGLATPGQVRAAARYDVYPVLAQQSMRELNLTKRDYPGVVADATFLVFQEGFERGYGADGDHLKSIKDIDVALDAGMPMITLDLTEVMSPEPATWAASKIDSEFEKLDGQEAQRVLSKYADRTFKLSGSTIHFSQIEVKRCALMYLHALDFSREVDAHLKERRGDAYDLEISIDETTAPTLPSHHLFIASELEQRGVSVNSLAPRFIGEFQKGIDYIGDVSEFERQFTVHCDIAKAYGSYKVSIHSGSDKFAVYPAIGKYTGMRLHLKTAGTSWLEAVRVIARTNPSLFRHMLGKAFTYFPEATKLYYITADIRAIRKSADVSDSELESFVTEPNSRQLLHITYGGLLTDPEVRAPFFATLDRNEELHYRLVEEHIGRHIELLGAPRIGA